MMALSRKLLPVDRSVRLGKWDYQVSIPICRYSELTIGIIGLGRIGKNFAMLVKPLGARVIAADPLYPEESPRGEGEDFSFISMTGLEELLQTADVVSVHCPLESSFHMIDEKRLKMMKSNSYIINVSRGGIIDELALERALSEKWIAGAACDVLETEPPQGTHPLLKHKNFICTPHMAWYSVQASQDLKRKLAEEIVRYLNGEDLRYQLN
jgi:D-3-phosphoglycerate dehydrogenase